MRGITSTRSRRRSRRGFCGVGSGAAVIEIQCRRGGNWHRCGCGGCIRQGEVLPIGIAVAETEWDNFIELPDTPDVDPNRERCGLRCYRLGVPSALIVRHQESCRDADAAIVEHDRILREEGARVLDGSGGAVFGDHR